MKEKTSISQKLQKFGSVLAGMVIPNIGAFIRIWFNYRILFGKQDGLQMQNLQN